MTTTNTERATRVNNTMVSQINDQSRRPDSVNTTTAPIIEKIKKLLALANSSNEHEAALAAGHAQRLLSEHNLAMADIDATHKPDIARV